MSAPRTAPHVRLVDRKTRVVELWAPASPVSRYPTDRELYVDMPASIADYVLGPQPVGLCFEVGPSGRRARFLVEEGRAGDRLLDVLASRRFPVRRVEPYGPKGWAVR